MLLFLLACTTETPTPKDSRLAHDDSVKDQQESGPTDSPVDSPSDSPQDSPVDTTPPPPTVRFVALGDAGEGNADQFAVAAAMESVCARDGCDFALYLGDNFYDTGVSDVDDAQFQEKFEIPYANLNFPFYIVLGNHDYGGEGVGWELWKGQTYVDYADHSNKWIFPDLYYSFQVEHVAFWALDTTQVFWGIKDDQLAWLQGEMAASTATWKLAFAHHPYISNGTHGNAGSYDGLDFLPIVNGEFIKEFVEDGICGQADVYICGHDHSMQWLDATCGTEFLVSGAGSKTTDLPGVDPIWFEENTPGFMWVEISGNTFTGVFYDENGQERYRRSFTK